MTTSRTELTAALVLALALGVLGAAFGTARKDAADPRASTFNDAPRGLRALWLVLEDVGAKPQRTMRPPAAGDPTDRTLVLAAPSEVVTRRETAQLVEWVRAGGRLVVVGSGAARGHESPFLDAVGVSSGPLPPVGSEGVRVRDAALREGLGRIEWPATVTVSAGLAKPGAGAFEELVTAGGRCSVGRLRFGDAGGEVVVVADARLLDDEGLFRADNAVLAVRLLLGRGAVAFDEFHHGFRADGGDGRLASVLASMLFGTWPGRALLVVALAGLLHLIGAAVRLGAPEPERAPARRAFAEHAEALGRLFETARARRETLAILAAGARRVAGQRTGIPPALPSAEFVRRLRLSQAPHAADLASAIERAESAGTAKDVEMAAAAANLAAAKRRFLHGG